MSGAIACMGGLGLLLLGLDLLARRGGLLASRWLARGGEGAPWPQLPLLVLLQSPATTQSLLASLGNSGRIHPATALGLVCCAELGPLLTLWLGVFAGALWAPGLVLLACATLLIGGRRQALQGAFTGLIAGLGTTLIGLNLVHGGLAELASVWEFPSLLRLGPVAAVAWIGIGAGLALLSRAPGAIAALAVGAVGTALLPLASAGCALVGATAGATLIALSQALNSSATARRLALAQAGATLLLALVQLALLPMLLLADESLPAQWPPELRLGLLASAALLLWGALMTPLAASTGQWLAGRLSSPAGASPLQDLDGHSARHPALAEAALQDEWQRLARHFEEVVRAHWQSGITVSETGWQQLLEHIEALEDWLQIAAAQPDGTDLLPWRESWAPLALFARQQPPRHWPEASQLPAEAHDTRYRYQEAARRALAVCADPERELEGMWEALDEKYRRHLYVLQLEAEAGRISSAHLTDELQRLWWLNGALEAMRQAREAL